MHTSYVHVHNRAWKNKLRMVKPENQVEMYQTLSVLVKELDVSVFQKRLSSFVQLWMPIEPDFVKYFTQHYQNRAGKNVSCTNPKFDYLIITYREMGKVLPPF